MKKIVFITRAGLMYGWGHFFRVLSLSEYLKKEFQCKVEVFVSGDKTVKRFFASQKAQCHFIDVRYEINVIEQHPCDVLIIDLLHIPEALQKQAKHKAKCVVFFNDLGQTYENADIVVSPQYLPMRVTAPKNTQVLYGPNYFLVKQDLLWSRRKRSKPVADVGKIVCIAGGSIRKRIFERLLAIVKHIASEKVVIDVICGYDRDFRLDHYRAKHKDICFKEGVKNMGKCLYDADLVITSSGYLKYEVAYVGTPMVLFSINAHQHMLSRAFITNAKTGLYIGDIRTAGVPDTVRKIKMIMNDAGMRRKFTVQGKRVVDGKGYERVCQSIKRRMA